MYIKDFDRFMFHRIKNKNNKWFCRSCLHCFSNKNVLNNHEENCLSINGAQSVKLEKVIIEFKNYCRQTHCPFKIYCDFECNLEGVEIYEGSYSKKYHNHIPYSFVFKVVCIDDRFRKSIVVFMGENAAYEFIKAILKEYEHCKKVMKKVTKKKYNINQATLDGFVKNSLIMTMKKLRDNFQVIGKFRGAAHWSCNINL